MAWRLCRQRCNIMLRKQVSWKLPLRSEVREDQEIHLHKALAMHGLKFRPDIRMSALHDHVTKTFRNNALVCAHDTVL
eukprot:jgi/Botrbrau1/21915/Bobra.0249s0041.1